MSETDSFIEEVAEEVRRDRLFKMFRKYGWIAGLLVVIVVGGAAWNEYRKASQETAAQKLGDAILSAMAIEDADARAGALADLSAEGDAAAVLALVTASAQVQAGDIRAADDALAALAANGDIPTVYRDLARLKRLYLRGNGLEGADRAATIDSLAQPGGAFRTLAMEQRALMLVEEGDNEGAISVFTELLNDSESTQQLVTRARQMIIVLGGTLANG